MNFCWVTNVVVEWSVDGNKGRITVGYMTIKIMYL